MKVAKLIPGKHRQAVINYAFWYAVEVLRRNGSSSLDEMERSVAGMVTSFLKQGWTPDELTIAASKRVSLRG